MNQSFALTSAALDIALRTITEADLENLRQWKNLHRFSFFHQEIIPPLQQVKWYREYCARSNDYMFVVIDTRQTIGCMGFRLLESAIDIYNVIRGKPGLGKPGGMSQAMRLLCSYIVANWKSDIVAKVLTTNPAIAWYEKNHFSISARHDTYVEMKLDCAHFSPCRFLRQD